MRTSLLFSLVLAELAALPAAAAPPLHSDEEESQAPPQMQAPSTTPAPPAPPGPTSAPTQGPLYFNGPVYVIPATPGSAPPLPAAPPVYPAAPPIYTAPVARRTVATRPRAPALEHRFGLGGRAAGMWMNQRLYGSDLLLLGGGVQARLRVSGQVALEASFDVLSKDIHEGVFDRTSYPIQLAALFYAMPPQLSRHFNVYGALGGGVMPSRITLDDRNYPRAELQQNELLGQAGVGCELRMWRVSLNADARVIGTYRTGDGAAVDALVRPSSGDNSLSLTQPAMQDRSYGWTFNLGAMFWL